MSVLVIPAGFSGPHTLADFRFRRPCRSCAGEGTEDYFPGEVLRDYRESAWGKRSLRRMAREIGIPATSLSAMERGERDFDEDTARRFLMALGIL